MMNMNSPSTVLSRWHQIVPRRQESCSLSPGERVGVRDSVNSKQSRRHDRVCVAPTDRRSHGLPPLRRMNPHNPKWNPEGVLEISPGLRRDAGRYPGKSDPKILPNPERVVEGFTMSRIAPLNRTAAVPGRSNVNTQAAEFFPNRVAIFPSPIGWDLSRLGSGERFAVAIATLLVWERTLQEREFHRGVARGPRGPSERERASHWAGVRAGFRGKSLDPRPATLPLPP